MALTNETVSLIDLLNIVFPKIQFLVAILIKMKLRIPLISTEGWHDSMCSHDPSDNLASKRHGDISRNALNRKNNKYNNHTDNKHTENKSYSKNNESNKINVFLH